MIGRIVGFVAGAAIAVTGFGMLKPAIFAKYFNFSKLSLGPFSEYHTLVCWMIVVVGLVVALASLQRPAGGSGRKRTSSPAVFDPEESEPAPAHGPLTLAPEPEDEPFESHADHDEAHQPIMEEHGSPSRPSPRPLW